MNELGEPIGQRNSNPILDTWSYFVEFPDGTELEYMANTIAKNMWAQCNIDGNQWLLKEAITDHWNDGMAVSHDKAFVEVNG